MNNKELSIVNSAEAFSNNFFNMADDSQIQTDYDTSLVSLFKNNNQNDSSQMYTIPVTEGEIQSLICFLETNNSSGYDGVSTKILKMCN